jgi:hypothetical protein
VQGRGSGELHSPVRFADARRDWPTSQGTEVEQVRPQMRGRGAAAGVAEHETVGRSGTAPGHGELKRVRRGIRGYREVLKPKVRVGAGYVDAGGDQPPPGYCMMSLAAKQ